MPKDSNNKFVMANYDDYQLDEMEDAAVNKSKNLKRGLLAGAGVLGVGGTAAFAASQMSSDDEAPLTSEDLLAGANAGAENIEDAQEEATAQDNNTTHETVKEVHHTYVVENNGGESGSHPGAGEELDVNVRESSVLFDEEGNIVSTIDAGTVNGKDFMVIDNDLNGKGDVLAYDANGNGVYEDNEIVQLDNNSWEMGKGQEFHAYAQTEDGDIVEVYVDDPNGKSDIADIHNDFEDERTGEIYENDLAQNNPDYNNEDQQRAGFEGESLAQDDTMQEDFDDPTGIIEGEEMAYEPNYDGLPAENDIQNDLYGEVDETESYAYDEPSYEDTPDYGYSEPAADDMASYDAGADSFDDVSYDA